MSAQLQALIRQAGLKQARLAEACGISEAAVTQIVRHGLLPKREAPAVLDKFAAALAAAGLPEKDIRAALADLADLTAPETLNPPEKEQIAMILKRQSLTQAARQAFGLVRNPFDEPARPEHVFLTPQARYVREAMRDAACNGNFLAVVGESGAGKSVLREELGLYLAENEKDVVVIEPYVLTMALSDNGAGKPLRTSHVIEAIINKIDPSVKKHGSPEVMAQRVHDVLRRSADAGNRHVLIIEEAHDLHTQTLKALKRFWELKFQMRRLLSIILIGQSELRARLNSTSADVREVVQRCDVVTLPPLPDVGEFLRHRFAAAGYEADALFSRPAMAELRQRLIVGQDRNNKGVDMAYPLAVSNLAVACLNFAAASGLRQVDDDVVRTVQIGDNNA